MAKRYDGKKMRLVRFEARIGLIFLPIIFLPCSQRAKRGRSRAGLLLSRTRFRGAGIGKRATSDTFRRCFATHLLESGYSHGPGAPRAQRCERHHDLYACAEYRRVPSRASVIDCDARKSNTRPVRVMLRAQTSP
jgi:hypothetical protein